MKSKLLTSILFLIFWASTIFCQNNIKCNAYVFLNPDFKGTKALYDKPNGKIIKYLQHNFNEEDYIGFKILDKNDSMFYVSANYEIKGFIAKGWIKKDKNIGIYSRAYDCSLKLYSKPNISSKINYTIKQYDPNMYVVVDCCGKWLKIKKIYNGVSHSGWISPDMQCSNVYSTCD